MPIEERNPEKNLVRDSAEQRVNSILGKNRPRKRWEPIGWRVGERAKKREREGQQ